MRSPASCAGRPPSLRARSRTRFKSRALSANDAASARASFTVVVREVNAPPRIEAIPDAAFAIGSQDAFEVGIAASDPDLPAQPLEFRLGAGAPAGMGVDRVTGLLRWVPTPEQAGQTHSVEVLVSDPDTAESPQRLSFRVTVLAPERKEQVETGVTAAIYLLAIEEPASGTVFPFAVAFAVRNDLLMTSGYAVQELAKARDEGMSVLAMDCASREMEHIEALYLHPEFTRLQDRPEEQIYVDVGVVQLPGKERALAPLADPNGALPLEQGAPVHCVMPIFEAEPLTRFDDVRPAYHSAKIYVVTRQPGSGADAAGNRRMLHLVGALPKNAHGSPIVNEQGQVIAIYVEKADLSEDASLSQLADRYHYAVMLDALADSLRGELKAWWQVLTAGNADSSRKLP